MGTVDTAIPTASDRCSTVSRASGTCAVKHQLLAQDEILGLKPRSPREPRLDSKQQLGQKCDHRPLHYHTPTRASSGMSFSVGTPTDRPARDGLARRVDRRAIAQRVVAPDRASSALTGFVPETTAK